MNHISGYVDPANLKPGCDLKAALAAALEVELSAPAELSATQEPSEVDNAVASLLPLVTEPNSVTPMVETNSSLTATTSMVEGTVRQPLHSCINYLKQKHLEVP